MTTFTPEWLYRLLPSVYRELDPAQGYPLRALTTILAEQGAVVAADIEQLWNDFFIETCRPWVIPYIADLVGTDLLFDAAQVDPSRTAEQLFPDLAGHDLRPKVAARVRADVGRTIHYRRRKGTATMLEQLASDVTGWPAHVAEFFQVLARTAPAGSGPTPASGWVDRRGRDQLDRLNGPFDTVAHTVDVRSVGQSRGWHGIHHVGFFLWRAASHPMETMARPAPSAPAWRFSINPLGAPMQQFAAWSPPSGSASRSGEFTVGGPITRSLLRRDLAAHRAAGTPPGQSTDLYGDHGSLLVSRIPPPLTPGSVPAAVPYQDIRCCPLRPWPAHPPAGAAVAVDPATGRLALGSDLIAGTAAIRVRFHQGAVANLGGGPYDRRAWVIPPVGLSAYQVSADGVSLVTALEDWRDHGGPGGALITIVDSASYDLPATITLKDSAQLVIQAADGQRPVIRAPLDGEVTVIVSAAGSPTNQAALTLSGVVLEGRLTLQDNAARIRLLHSTLVPGGARTEDGAPASTKASLTIKGGQPNAEINTQLRFEAAFSIAGPIIVPAHAAGIWLLDSIVDGIPQQDGAPDEQGRPGPAIAGTADGGLPAAPLHIERSTIFGRTSTVELDASETIFTGPVNVRRTQQGCVRFSYLPPGSTTPRRFRCQPAETAAGLAARVVPNFTSTTYGDFAYGQLSLECPPEILTGSEDGSEMGALSHLKQAQRESNLRTRLREYLPFGLDAGVIYVT